MKRSLYLAVIFFFALSACKNSSEKTDEQNAAAAAAKAEASNKRAAALFASVNEKIYGDVHTLLDGKFKNFKMKDYYQHLKQYRSPRAEEHKENLKDFESQTLYAYPKTFVICMYSKKRNLAVCDDARCPGIDKSEVGSPDLIQEWLTDFPVGICPLTPKINY